MQPFFYFSYPELRLEEGYTLKLDQSFIAAYWGTEDDSRIFDSEFEEIWNDLLGDHIREGLTLNTPLYSDENCEHPTGETMWSKFWDKVISPNHILLEVYESYNTPWFDEKTNLEFIYLINKLRISEQIGEYFQADPECIKSRFQAKSHNIMSYIVVDIEADGPIPFVNSMVCFGAVIVEPTLSKTYYARTKPISDNWNTEALAISGFSREEYLNFEIAMYQLKPEGSRRLAVNDYSLVKKNN